MLKLIVNKEYKAPKHFNDIDADMCDIVWAWGSSSIGKYFSKSQLKKIRDNYKYREFQTLKFRGLSTDAKKILAELMQLNAEYIDTKYKYYNIDNSIGLKIIHSESESMRFLRANMKNYNKRQAKLKEYYNTGRRCL